MANNANKNKGDDRGSSAATTAGDIKQKAQDAAGNVADKARDMASSAGERARDMASSAAQSARDLASSAGQRAEEMAGSVAGGMQSLAGTIRESAPRGGMMGTAASSVASGLETGGRYLEEHGFGDMGDDLARVVRRNPLPSLFVAVGFGFLLARIMRS